MGIGEGVGDTEVDSLVGAQGVEFGIVAIICDGGDAALEVDSPGIGLDAARFAAAAGPTADDDLGMADLAGVVAGAGDQLAAAQDGAADAGAHIDGEHVVDALYGTIDVFPPQLGIEIIDQSNRRRWFRAGALPMGAKFLHEIDVPPAQIRSIEHGVSVRRQLTGQTDAGGLDVAEFDRRFRADIAEHVDQCRRHFARRSVVADALAALADRFPPFVEEVNAGIGAADVETGSVCHDEVPWSIGQVSTKLYGRAQYCQIAVSRMGSWLIGVVMKRWNWMVGAFVVATALVIAPGSLAADEGEMPITPLSSEVLYSDSGPSVPGSGLLGLAIDLEVAVGFKGGFSGVAGTGFDNHEQVSDGDGTTLSFPSGAHNPWVYPEYYGHFGLGGTGGLSLEFRLNGIFGFETGLMYSQDNASGYVDKNHAPSGTTISRIHSEQTTTALHIPLLLKAVLPGMMVRPFFGAGIQLVVQSTSELEYEQEQRAGQYGGDGAMDELNRRNQIEESTYPLLAFSGGIEFAVAGIRVPVELRLGYAMGSSGDLDERARYDASQDQVVYDGVYRGHIAILTGVLYEFEL